MVLLSRDGASRKVTTRLVGIGSFGESPVSTACFSRQPARALSQKMEAATFPGVAACW